MDMRFIFLSLSFPLILLLSACDVNLSVTPGGIEDVDKPKVIEGLAPLPEGYYDFALESAQLFFEGGRDSVEARLHPALAGETGVTWALLEKLASDTADFGSAEYYGHGFGEDEGLDLTVVQLKVPFEGGYNLVKVVMASDEACCRLAGLNVEAKMLKTFKLGE